MNQLESNKRYLAKKDLVLQQFLVNKEVKRVYKMATSYFGTDMSSPLVKEMIRINSKFINEYEKGKPNRKA